MAVVACQTIQDVVDKSVQCCCFAENLGSWQADRLSSAEEMRFTYEEEQFPEEFFVPYVWSLAVSNTTIPWNLHAIALFQPVALSIPHADVLSDQLEQLSVDQSDSSSKRQEQQV